MYSITLQTSSGVITDGMPLGSLGFAASSEADSGIADDVVAKIEAVAEKTFDADENATEFVFYLAADGTVGSKMTLSSGGKLTTSHVVTTGVAPLTSQTGAVEINALLGTYHTVAATGDITINITNAVAGQKILIRIVYDDEHALAFHSSTTVIWPGGTEPSPTNTGIDVYGFLCTTGSTAFDGFIIGEALA